MTFAVEVIAIQLHVVIGGIILQAVCTARVDILVVSRNGVPGHATAHLGRLYQSLVLPIHFFVDLRSFLVNFTKTNEPRACIPTKLRTGSGSNGDGVGLAFKMLVRHVKDADKLLPFLPYAEVLVDLEAVPHYGLNQQTYRALWVNLPAPAFVMVFGGRVGLRRQEVFRPVLSLIFSIVEPFWPLPLLLVPVSIYHEQVFEFRLSHMVFATHAADLHDSPTEDLDIRVEVPSVVGGHVEEQIHVVIIIAATKRVNDGRNEGSNFMRCYSGGFNTVEGRGKDLSTYYVDLGLDAGRT